MSETIDIPHCYERLIAMKDKLSDSKNTNGHSANGSGDIVDITQRQEARVLHEADTERNAYKSFEIAEALNRITTGTYGKCVRCMESIGEERLSAKPEVATCIDCQRDIEKGKSPAVSRDQKRTEEIAKILRRKKDL